MTYQKVQTVFPAPTYIKYILLGMNAYNNHRSTLLRNSCLRIRLYELNVEEREETKKYGVMWITLKNELRISTGADMVHLKGWNRILPKDCYDNFHSESVFSSFYLWWPTLIERCLKVFRRITKRKVLFCSGVWKYEATLELFNIWKLAEFSLSLKLCRKWVVFSSIRKRTLCRIFSSTCVKILALVSLWKNSSM